MLLEKLTAEKLKLKSLEEQMDSKTLQEKQKFFEKAFQSDLENYKRLGATALGIIRVIEIVMTYSFSPLIFGVFRK